MLHRLARSRVARLALVAAAALPLLTLLAARARAWGPAEDPAPAELVVTTADFAFSAPRRVPAGLTRVVLKNGGAEHHHVQLVRLADGHTYAEYMARLAAGDLGVPWATFVGGPDTPGPGGESEATLMLTEGEYVMLCLISGSDKVPHLAKGMSLPISVGPPATPVADTRMVLDEYSFSISPELRVGRRTIRIENRGSQVHHVALVRLAEGRTAEEAMRWAAKPVGTAPGQPVGGTTGIAPGLVNYITVDLTAGEYALICFIPDARDGRSHAHHGMLRQLRVR